MANGIKLDNRQNLQDSIGHSEVSSENIKAITIMNGSTDFVSIKLDNPYVRAPHKRKEGFQQMEVATRCPLLKIG